MKALKELLAIAQDASKQRNSDIIAQFKADHADELSKDKEKMWCLLMPEDEEKKRQEMHQTVAKRTKLQSTNRDS
jgi:hypothetical protein